MFSGNTTCANRVGSNSLQINDLCVLRVIFMSSVIALYDAKIRINEHNTKQKLIFLFLLSSESIFDEVRDSENRTKCKINGDLFSFLRCTHLS